MKSTIEIPDAIHRQVKARAALKGQSVRAFVIEALEDKLRAEKGGARGGWQSVFGKAGGEDLEALQRLIDAEFSRIDPGEWK
jgi:plasmid stability protein